VLVLILLGIAVVFPNKRRYVISVTVLLFLYIGLNLTVLWHKADITAKEAVVMVPEVESKFGPFDSATKFFTLREGAKVAVINCKGDWCRVKRDDGKAGWINNSDIERI
jgi:hypothetical protein